MPNQSPAANVPPDAPWLQQLNEGSEPYAAFCAYRDMGPGRSIDEAYRRQLDSSTATRHNEHTMRASVRWTAWWVAYDWFRRATAYDRHLQRAEVELRERLTVRNGIHWAEERADDIRERLEIYRNLRRGLLQRTADAPATATRKEITWRDDDGRSITVEETFSLADEFRILHQLQKTLFPPDDMEVSDQYGNKWSKFDLPASYVIAEGAPAASTAAAGAAAGAPAPAAPPQE